MHPFTLTSLFLYLVLCAASPVAKRTTDYRETVRTTPKGNGFFLRVDSVVDDVANNRNLQLRLGGSGDYYIAVVDATSPVLAGRMSKGRFQSQSVVFGYPPTPDGRFAKLGPKSYYNGGKLALQELQFNASTTADDGWQLDFIDPFGGYWLYHNEPIGTTNGFLLCTITESGETFYQPYYSTTKAGEPGPNPKGCKNIALETTLAPR